MPHRAAEAQLSPSPRALPGTRGQQGSPTAARIRPTPRDVSAGRAASPPAGPCSAGVTDPHRHGRKVGGYRGPFHCSHPRTFWNRRGALTHSAPGIVPHPQCSARLGPAPPRAAPPCRTHQRPLRRRCRRRCGPDCCEAPGRSFRVSAGTRPLGPPPLADWCPGRGSARGTVTGGDRRPMREWGGADAQPWSPALSPPPPRAGV